MPNQIDNLLDSMGITDPFMRDLMYGAILSEMSMPLTKHISKGGRTHTRAQCRATRKQGAPKGCVLHKPTLHKLTGSPQILRSSTLIEDQCQHGVGHPNPDSAAFLNWRDGSHSWGVHGCDGCCGAYEPKPAVEPEGEF